MVYTGPSGCRSGGGRMIQKKIIKDLVRIVGKADVLVEKEDLVAYSYDGTTSWTHEPDAVVFPTSAREIAEILKLATRERIPVTPRGAGTNVSGGSIPIQGGIVLCFTKMNRILGIDKENLIATVEPGVVLMDLNTALAKEGLFFPPDPQSFLGATIGGIVAENAGGPACVKYGVTKQYVLGLEVVLPSGAIIDVGSQTIKNVVGYDLTMLFTGSEGTLGVISKATLAVKPLPQTTKTIAAAFEDLALAGANVSHVLASGVIPSKIELLDKWVIKSIERLQPMGLPVDAEALLLFEVDGVLEAVEKDARQIEGICKGHGAREIRIAKDKAEADRYWLARRAGYAALFSAGPTIMAEDVTVPRNKIPALIKRVKEICEPLGIEFTVIGHAGDGNLHPSLVTDKKNREHFKKAQEAMEMIIEYAVELGGVVSGEHGIGLEKKGFLMRTVPPRPHLKMGVRENHT
jgi:glycolate oxidase